MAESNERSELLIHQERTSKKVPKNLKLLIGVAVAVLLVIIIAVGIGVGVSVSANSASDSAAYSKAAVASDAAACSTVGVNMLKKGGSAVDAAIAAQLCLGVVNLHSTGIGGGGFMVYYNDTSGETVALDYRDVAPLAASTFMYNDTASDSHIRGNIQINLSRYVAMGFTTHAAYIVYMQFITFRICDCVILVCDHASYTQLV